VIEIYRLLVANAGLLALLFGASVFGWMRLADAFPEQLCAVEMHLGGVLCGLTFLFPLIWMAH